MFNPGNRQLPFSSQHKSKNWTQLSVFQGRKRGLIPTRSAPELETRNTLPLIGGARRHRGNGVVVPIMAQPSHTQFRSTKLASRGNKH